MLHKHATRPARSRAVRDTHSNGTRSRHTQRERRHAQQGHTQQAHATRARGRKRAQHAATSAPSPCSCAPTIPRLYALHPTRTGASVGRTLACRRTRVTRLRFMTAAPPPALTRTTHIRSHLTSPLVSMHPQRSGRVRVLPRARRPVSYRGRRWGSWLADGRPGSPPPVSRPPARRSSSVILAIV